MIRIQPPASPIRASVRLPGSKSISNRLLILNELGGRKLELNHLSDAEDTQLLKNALALIKRSDVATIDVNHAGTDMRFLTALLSVTPGQWTLTGSERLKKRPIAELVRALRCIGAQIEYAGREGFPPLLIKGTGLRGGHIEIDAGISSQFISALLLISPKLKDGLSLKLNGNIVSEPYVDMTIELMKLFGVSVQKNQALISAVYPPNGLTEESALVNTREFDIESDWSSASYWYSICALSPGSSIQLTNLHPESYQADAVLPSVYERLGVESRIVNGVLHLKQSSRRIGMFEYDFTRCPDIAQTLAVSCFGLGLPARLTGLQTLTIKETDRIEALKTEFAKFGFTVETGKDSLFLPQHERRLVNYAHLPINTWRDHRMALSFAPLALVYPGLQINNEHVVSKSYPGFWDDLKNAGFSVTLQP